MDTRMIEIKNQLKNFVSQSGVRHDWHEPDNQGVSAKMTGNHLDNAFGIHQDGLIDQEFVVHLNSDNGSFDINLADLLAIAAAN